MGLFEGLISQYFVFLLIVNALVVQWIEHRSPKAVI